MTIQLKNTFCLWFTGLSGSGKSTLATGIEKRLNKNGLAVEHLDGDEIRKGISNDLGFSKEDRKKNNERVIFLTKILVRNSVPTIAAFISPFESIRNLAKKEIKNLILIHVKCSLDECKRRDPKGLYKKALAGEIKDFTGIDSPFEEPKNADIVLDTENKEVNTCVDEIMTHLLNNGYIKDSE